MKEKIFNFKTLLIVALMGVIMLYLIGIYLSRPKQIDIVRPLTLLKLNDVTFPSKSGAMLHGWYLQGNQGKGSIVLMHGLRSNRLQMLNRAEILNKAGYSVLLFDFQGHGKSIGEKITFGKLESLDAEAAFNYLKEKNPTNKVGVIGVSLGGAATLLGNVKNMVDAIILESVFPSIEQAIENRLKVKIGDIGTYLLPILTLQLELQLGIHPSELQPIAQIQKVKNNLLVIGADKDMRTTLAETQSLFNAATAPKELWIVKGASHIDFDTYDEKEYFEKVLRFFDKYL